MDKGLEKRKKVILDLMNDPLYVPMKQKELAIVLDLPKERREELVEALEALTAECKIECSKRGKYSIMKEKYYEGIFTSHQNGFGFVTCEGHDEDFFIPQQFTNFAMPGDKVSILLMASPVGKRQEAKVVKIIEHALTEVIGTFEKSKSFGFVVPDNQKLNDDIFIKKNDTLKAKTGDKVVVKLLSYGGNGKKPEGKVIEILGGMDEPGVDILSIARGYGLVEEFNDEVLDELNDVADEVPESDKENRLDLRDVIMVTIDGEDAKDLDDAISVSLEDDHYNVGVHIADVSHYVREGTELNKEGYNRGTSVYLADRVIPMLPRKLSNGLCSLNMGVDRLALSCLMTVDMKGNIIDHTIQETVINVNRRMSYTEVRDILEGTANEELLSECEELIPMFQVAAKVSELFRENRRKRGSINFDFPETKLILDDKGHTIDLKPYERNIATDLIEDFMLAANETVAEEYYWREIPFLYRTHEKPDAEKLQKLAIFINNFGLTLKGSKEDMHPKELQKLLAKIDGRPECDLIMRLALRSMQQAKYTKENSGHFGLAAKYYCHFTSPIRRYPDLQIHRIIKEDLHGGLNNRRLAHYDNILDEVGMHCSSRERRAEEAERETVKLKKIEYIKDHFDEEFEGVISSVTNWGIYVELPNTIEGLVHVNSLKDDYYEYHEDTYEMVGKVKNKHYKLGQSVRVRLNDVDLLSRTIDFVLVED